MTKPSIAVKGIGRLSVKPDQIQLTLKIKAENKDYNLMMDEANEKLESLTASLTSSGFTAEDLKTGAVSIDSRYEYVRKDDGAQTREFVGYTYSQAINVKFPMDMDLLSKAVSSISCSNVSPELSISFTLADRDALRDKLLKMAAEDARHKAEVISKASGTTLGSVKEISYDIEGCKIQSPTKAHVLRSCSSEAMVNMTPEEIIVEESVFFVWGLKQSS